MWASVLLEMELGELNVMLREVQETAPIMRTNGRCL